MFANQVAVLVLGHQIGVGGPVANPAWDELSYLQVIFDDVTGGGAFIYSFHSREFFSVITSQAPKNEATATIIRAMPAKYRTHPGADEVITITPK
jgi:hypothetical protein